MERWNQGRPPAGSKRVPLPDEAGLKESALGRARRLDREARERHGLDDGEGPDRPDRPDRPRRVYPGGSYRDWGYGPYGNHGYDRPYGEWYGDDWSNDDRGFNQDWERDDWDDWGEPAGRVADAGVGVEGAAGGAGRRAEWGAGWDERDLPLLPPDDLLLDRGLSPEVKAALDESLEWRQATAELIEAWGAYARAVNRVLAEVRRTPEYRKAREELKRAEAKLGGAQGRGEAQALQTRPATAGRAPNPRGAAARADRLFPLADAVFDARQAVRSIEQEAMGADAQVRAAQRRLDDAIQRRNKVREKTEASLPKADGDRRRPTLLEDE